MKKKIHKIWGVGLALVLVASLLAFAAPVSAGTLSWSTESIPSTTGKVLQPGTNVVDLAVADDGTMYAVTSNTATFTLGTDTEWSAVEKVSGGYSAYLDAVSSSSHPYVDFTPATGITTEDLEAAPEDFSFWYYLSVLRGPHLELRFTSADAEDVDITFMLQQEAFTGSWQEVVIGTTSIQQTSIYEWATSEQDDFDFDTAEGLAFLADNFTAYELTRVRVELYPAEVRDCYIDDVTIDGTLYDLEPGFLYKSTNTGVTWSKLNMPGGQLVAVAPDNADIVATAAKETPMVYISSNGGSTWGSLGRPGSADNLNDMAISATAAEVNYLAVAGEESSDADVWIFNVGAAAPSWKDTAGETGFQAEQNLGLAVAFSPNFASDYVMTAVTGTDDLVYFQMWSESTDAWNFTGASFVDYPVEIQNDTDPIKDVSAASITLSPEYLGSDDTMRIAFVGLTTNEEAALAGVYRLKDTTDKAIDDGINIHSIDFDGINLVAGAADTNKVRRSDDPLATTPDFSSASSLKRPGMTDTDLVVVAWNGADVVAGTSGTGSAFSVSRDDGKSFNDLSLIDTAGGDLGSMLDVAVSADGSKVYLLVDDGNALSLWRKASSWERVLALASTTDYIVRIAPEDADVVYIARKGAKNIYYSSEGGDTKWFARTSRYDIQDLAVEGDGSVAYIAKYSDTTVSRTENTGFTWGSAKSSGVTGNIHTIASIDEDELIVGSDEGYVAYSIDGNSSWTKINKQLGDGATVTNTQVIASGLSTDDYIYASAETAAGTASLVERWQIGQTGTSWKNLKAPTTVVVDEIVEEKEVEVSYYYAAYGIGLEGGVLYVLAEGLNEDEDNSAVLRTLSPESAEPSAGMWSTLTSAGEVFNRTPSALRVSAGSNKLWTVDIIAPKFFSYTDTLAEAGPTLVAPDDGVDISINPVSGYAYDVTFTWDRPSKSTFYQLRIAVDEDFTQKVQTFTSAAATTDDPVSVLVGPTGAGGELNYMPETTYYWKVRAYPADPKPYSPWSESRSFTIKALELVAPPVVIQPAPPTPQITVTVPPAPEVILPAPEIILPAPLPAPEIVIPPAPAPVPVIPDIALWAIIIIGAILVLAVIVLIVRTRRPA